jgi:DNA polymerase III delta subunit
MMGDKKILRHFCDAVNKNIFKINTEIKKFSSLLPLWTDS